jgi:hypothetical protein
LQPRAADFGIPGVSVDAGGLRVTDPLSYEAWEQVGRYLGVLRDLTAR